MKTFLILFFTICLSTEVYCQVPKPMQLRNLKYIDSVQQNMNVHFCGNRISYPMQVVDKKVKSDKKLISQVSFILDSMQQLDAVRTFLKKKNHYGENWQNGLINTTEFTFKGNYLTMKLTIESINKHIYRKQVEFTTSTKGICGNFLMKVPDFPLFKNHFIEYISVLLEVDFPRITGNQFSLEMLEEIQKNHFGYKFNIDQIKKPLSGSDSIFTDQFNAADGSCYYFKRADPKFSLLIKSRQVDILKKLLFSPNYVYAVNAMEALLYLKSINNISLEDVITKMDEIKYSPTPMKVTSDDVVHHYSNYKSINKSEVEILRKYQGL